MIYGLAKSLIIRPWLNIGIALCIEKGVRLRAGNPKHQMASHNRGYELQHSTSGNSRSLDPLLLPLRPPLDLILRLLAISFCATASYYLIEQPALRLRRRLFATKRRTPVHEMRGSVG